MVTLKNYINRVHYCTYNIQLFIVLPYVCFVEFLFLAALTFPFINGVFSFIQLLVVDLRWRLKRRERERERTQFQFSNISANGLALLPSAIPTESSSRSYKITL